MQQEFEHKLPARDIVIRQDNDASTFIEQVAGHRIPLIRIKDTVIGFSNIVSCELSVGNTFLPSISVSIDDTRYEFRQDDWIQELDIITVFIGNPQDMSYKSIKNDYRITDVSTGPGSPIVSFTAVLHVPELYVNGQYYVTGTSLDTMRQIATDCSLGFVHNLQAMSDSMTWLWAGRRVDWINMQILKHAYSDNTTSYIAFIDQFANLNFIDIRLAIDSSSALQLETDPVSGEAYDVPVPLTLTNNRLDKSTDILITYYTPDNNYGEVATTSAGSVVVNSLNHDQHAYVAGTVPGKLQVTDETIIQTEQSVNCHDNYDIAKAVNLHNRYLLQGQYLTCRLDHYVAPLFMYLSVPIEIHNAAMITNKNSQSVTDDQDDVEASEPASASNSHSINQNLSGECIITGMIVTYVRDDNGQNSESDHRLTHQITAFNK